MFGHILVLACIALSVQAYPVNNGLVYYHASPYYKSPYQNAMFLQYRSQPVNQRLTAPPTGVSAFALGNRVATGSYVKDAELVRRKYSARLESVQAVAEAYPDEDNEQVNSPEQAELEFSNDTPLSDTPIDDSPNVPQTVAQDAAVSSGQRPNPNIQLDDEDDDRYDSRRKQSSSGGSNTYFPVTFGSTNGGAIAIANAFSNGKGGSALSRATAYGSPSKKRVQ